MLQGEMELIFSAAQVFDIEEMEQVAEYKGNSAQQNLVIFL